ncbi:lipase member J-like isoform X2 [Lycorma delicatula]|uniref:lipase member J-like isoform X2 n=1 Tax=Lycorma delicatula TaxID=130591 RepID=UPI003F5138D8
MLLIYFNLFIILFLSVTVNCNVIDSFLSSFYSNDYYSPRSLTITDFIWPRSYNFNLSTIHGNSSGNNNLKNNYNFKINNNNNNNSRTNKNNNNKIKRNKNSNNNNNNSKIKNKNLTLRQTATYFNNGEKVLEDGKLTTPEIISKYGYNVETHQVVTEDGYLLTIFRIPGSSRSNKNTNTNGMKKSNVTEPVKKRRVIFLQHCILCSSSVFVLMGPNKSLAFLLADQGYDVWIGNSRGTSYSKNHVNMSTRSKDFWKFSWHEMGVYDLPAAIDYVLNKTQQEKIYYVGHSMGTTMMYALLSVRPQYNNKLNLVVNLSPVAFMSNIKSPVFRMLYGPISNMMNTAGMHEFIPADMGSLVTALGRQLCKEQAVTSLICSNVLFLIAGYDSDQLNRTMLPVIFGHLPAGTSTNSLMHYGQSIQTGYFKINKQIKKRC